MHVIFVQVGAMNDCLVLGGFQKNKNLNKHCQFLTFLKANLGPSLCFSVRFFILNAVDLQSC